MNKTKLLSDLELWRKIILENPELDLGVGVPEHTHHHYPHQPLVQVSGCEGEDVDDVGGLIRRFLS